MSGWLISHSLRTSASGCEQLPSVCAGSTWVPALWARSQEGLWLLGVRRRSSRIRPRWGLKMNASTAGPRSPSRNDRTVWDVRYWCQGSKTLLRRGVSLIRCLHLPCPLSQTHTQTPAQAGGCRTSRLLKLRPQLTLNRSKSSRTTEWSGRVCSCGVTRAVYVTALSHFLLSRFLLECNCVECRILTLLWFCSVMMSPGSLSISRPFPVDGWGTRHPSWWWRLKTETRLLTGGSAPDFCFFKVILTFC